MSATCVFFSMYIDDFHLDSNIINLDQHALMRRMCCYQDAYQLVRLVLIDSTLTKEINYSIRVQIESSDIISYEIVY